MNTRAKPLSEQIRAAVDACGTSRGAVCRATGILPSAMSRFMTGERGLRLVNLDRLAAALSLEVVTRRQRGR